MRGLKKQESNEFERFFAIVQQSAEKCGAVFFLFAGEGHEQEAGSMEMMAMSGWLVPEWEAQEFETLWKQSKRQSELESCAKFFTFATWRRADGTVSVSFTD